MIWRRQTSLLFAALLPTALLLAAIVCGACTALAPVKPDIPESVSPGWKRSSLTESSLPPGVPTGSSPQCWKADYTGAGSAQVWICWYKATSNAFEAVQRARAEAQTVKFQEEHYFILVKWNNVPKTDLTALIRAIQKALQTK